MNSHISHHSPQGPVPRAPGVTLVGALAQLDDGLARLDVLRLAFITANRKCRAALPQLPAILEAPIHLGTKLLFPPVKNVHEHYWNSSELQEIASGSVRYSGYRLGKTSDDAERIFDVPLATRRQAKEVLTAAAEHEDKCDAGVMPAWTCAEALIAQRLKVVALLNAVQYFEDESLPLEQQLEEDQLIADAHVSCEKAFRDG